MILKLKDAELARDAIMKKQNAEIAKFYKEWADEIGERAIFFRNKTTPSSVVSERYMKELKKQLNATSRKVSNEVYKKIKSNMFLISESVIFSNVKWLKDFGYPVTGINAAFSNVPDEVVRRLITGQVYESGWSLSKSIWSDNEKTLKDIYHIMAKGTAEQKSVYEISKELEKYVRPNVKLPWNIKGKDGVRIYKKKVDYNAQRLARTLSQHTYQQTLVTTSSRNPFVKGFIWVSNGSRVCDLCLDRDGQFFEKDNLPLDHPNGMCVMDPVISDDIENEIANWINEPDGTYPEIDKFAEYFGYNS